MRFEFATATRIVFGAGALREVAPAAKAMGTRAILVTGRSAERAAQLIRSLKDAGVRSSNFAVDGEPTVELVRRGAEFARSNQCGVVIAFGGGSAIDAGKAIAAALTNPGEITDYLEVIGKARPLTAPAAPCIAVPTTAGTGTEVTRNAVLASPVDRVKVSMRSPLMLPRLAVVDPELTYTLPLEITASTGLDALTQLIEPYVSNRANPITVSLCREGLGRVRNSLRRAWRDGNNQDARADMSLAALLGGLALANAGLGIVHGFAGPVGGMFPAPHGAVCAALLPHAMEANIRALRARAPESMALSRYDEVARALTGHASARSEDGAHWVGELCQELRIQPLRKYGVAMQDVSALIEKAAQASSTKANPIELTPAEMTEVVTRAI